MHARRRVSAFTFKTEALRVTVLGVTDGDDRRQSRRPPIFANANVPLAPTLDRGRSRSRRRRRPTARSRSRCRRRSRSRSTDAARGEHDVHDHVPDDGDRHLRPGAAGAVRHLTSPPLPEEPPDENSQPTHRGAPREPPGSPRTSSLRTSRRAQSTTTGAIQGIVTDEKTASALAGVTVIATSPSLAQTQTAITDEKGDYKINDLPPGDYLVTFYYADITVEHSGIHVGIDKATPVFQKINQAQAGGEVVHVDGDRADDRPDVDDAGHHDRQELHQEHPGPGPHVRSRRSAPPPARRATALGVVVLRSLVAREPVLRRRRQHDEPDVRHGRLAGHQRLHRRDRGHHRRLQRRVRSRDGRHRQRRHQVAARTSSRARSSATGSPAR